MEDLCSVQDNGHTAFRFQVLASHCGGGASTYHHFSRPSIHTHSSLESLAFRSTVALPGRILQLLLTDAPSTMAQVKTDPDAPYIKPDPDNKDAILADLEDEDIYEDAGDLEFSQSGQNVWLSRLPRQLWEHWAHLDDDEEVEIGTVRIEGEPGDLKRVSLTPVCVGLKFSHLSCVGQLALARPPR